MDPRIDRLADLLVGYSNAVKPGDCVLIGGSSSASPLVSALYKKILLAGGHPLCEIDDGWAQELLLKHANKRQLDFIPPWKKEEAEKIDCLFKVYSERNTRALSGVDPKKQQHRLKALKPLREIYHRRMNDETLRWCVTLFPTEAYAQDADMSLADFQDFVYKACKVDRADPVAAWKRMSRSQKKMAEFLNRSKTVRIVAQDTDISFSVRGRTWINCDGTENMPDGEVFTGPVEDSVEGKIRFSFPACYNGREVEGVRLEFKGGKVVKAAAAKNEDFLNEMLDLDAGARYLGEFSFATNFAIQRFTKSILFDEKIGGTVHFAVGSSYADSGGKNKSILHWDMVCDLRRGGKAYIDGKLFLKDGQFTRQF